MSQTQDVQDEKRHPIQVVSRRSGLSQDVLRAWENRYGLVTPSRSPGGRRLYSDADVERLRLIREAVAGGRRVGKLAPLSAAELTAIVQEDRRESLAAPPGGAADQSTKMSGALLSESLSAVNDLSQERLTSIIRKAALTLAPTVFIDEVVSRLMHQIGDLWFDGELSPAHEHLASNVMRNVLADLTTALQPPSSAPRVVVATPTGQNHEIGAMIVAAAAEYEGWHVTYLGADLPAEDIARATNQAHASAVALSVTYPFSDRLVENQLRELRQTLPNDITMLVGGQAAKSHAALLKTIGALYMTDLGQLRLNLRELAITLGCE